MEISKQRKSRKKNDLTQTIVLITAILNLVNALATITVEIIKALTG